MQVAFRVGSILCKLVQGSYNADYFGYQYTDVPWFSSRLLSGQSSRQASDRTDVPVHTLEWIFLKERRKHHPRPANCTPFIVMDALDLAVNIRGIG